MGTSEKNMKMYSMIFVILAVWDVFLLILDFIAGKYDIQVLMDTVHVGKTAATAAVILLTAVSLALAFIKLLAGIRGMRLTKDPARVRKVMTLTVTILIIYGCILIVCLFQYAGGKPDSLRTISAGITLLAAAGYLKSIFDYIKDSPEEETGKK